MAEPHQRQQAAWPWLAAAMGWSAYTTVGLQYVLFGSSLALSLIAWRPTSTGSQPFSHRVWPAGTVAFAVLAAWLLLSTLWTVAPAWQVATHAWPYVLVLLAAAVAAGCPRSAARSGLRHFVWASAAAALLNLAARAGALPELPLWQRAVDAQGNQRIATSIWFTLATVLALHFATLPRAAAGGAAPRRRERAAWLLAAVLCLLALATQDRRSGMVLLVPLLAIWAIRRQPTALKRWATVGALIVGAVAAWQVAPGARARFAEGVAELQAPRTPQTVNTSWGQRLYMLEITSGLVRERPWIGHGLGSWPRLWQQRTPAGSELQQHTTPHNEYLLTATQGGFPALLLLLAAVGAGVRAGWRGGTEAMPLLLTWSCLGVAGLFNAVLRDAKFELMLLMLASLAWAAARGQGVAMGVSRKPSAAEPGRDAPSNNPR